MKFFTLRILATLFFISLMSGPLLANRYDDREECCEKTCNTCCYECGCNPLYCGAWDLQGQVGVVPILWVDRGIINEVSCAQVVLAGSNSIFPLFNIPKFRTFFGIPWTVGGQIGYAASDNVRFYLEVNYLQARAKDTVLLATVGVTPATSILFNTKKYRLIDAYIGARYYWDRWCERVSFFLGAKAGLTHRNRVQWSPTITVSPSEGVVIPPIDLFSRNTVPSGGINFGFDYCYCGCWSFVLTGEIVASCGPKSNSNIAFGQPGAGCTGLAVQGALPAVPGINNLLIGTIGTEVRFPITAAVRYSF